MTNLRDLMIEEGKRIVRKRRNRHKLNWRNWSKFEKFLFWSSIWSAVQPIDQHDIEIIDEKFINQVIEGVFQN